MLYNFRFYMHIVNVLVNQYINEIRLTDVIVHRPHTKSVSNALSGLLDEK